MLRRTLQVVLMLVVLVSASAAQVFAMPCCESAAARVAPVVSSPVAEMHCHGAMEHMVPVVSALSHARCDAPVCRVHADTALVASERSASQPLQLPVSVAMFAPQHIAGASHRALQRDPPLIDRRSAIPLRV